MNDDAIEFWKDEAHRLRVRALTAEAAMKEMEANLQAAQLAYCKTLERAEIMRDALIEIRKNADSPWLYNTANNALAAGGAVKETK